MPLLHSKVQKKGSTLTYFPNSRPLLSLPLRPRETILFVGFWRLLVQLVSGQFVDWVLFCPNFLRRSSTSPVVAPLSVACHPIFGWLQVPIPMMTLMHHKTSVWECGSWDMWWHRVLHAHWETPPKPLSTRNTIWDHHTANERGFRKVLTREKEIRLTKM